MNKTNIIVGAIAVLALIVGGIAFLRSPSTITNDVSQAQPNQQFGAAGGTQMPNGKILPNPSVLDYFLARVALETDGTFMEGGATAATGIIEQSQVTACNQGIYAGSSTLFAIANPNNATSTFSITDMTATGQATTTSLLVGTSTATTTNAPTGSLVTSSLATSTSYFFAPGTGVGTGNSSGSNTYATIVVGPKEEVVGYATSTATGAGSNSFVPGITCLFKGQWEI